MQDGHEKRGQGPLCLGPSGLFEDSETLVQAGNNGAQGFDPFALFR